jgi:Mg-chelatase subunit ChlD
MKTNILVAFISAVAMFGPAVTARASTQEEGVALAIVYDTSGSMRDPVRDQAGKRAPKYVIANRALEAIAKQVQGFATNAGSAAAPRKIQAALFVFSNGQARTAIPFGPFDAGALRDWARNFSSPHGGTPLGHALRAAGQCVLNSPLSHKHVLVITDGLNTVGPPPETVMPDLKRQAAGSQVSLGIHFVAFDVDARQFESLKKQGATVVGAADEKQLDSQLEFILQRKILLEDEEPARK